MNKLSWLLYFGNVAGNLGPLFAFLGFLSIIATVFYALHGCIRLDRIVNAYKYQNNPNPIPKFRVGLLPPIVCALSCLVMWTCAALCPSQTTVYAIAASQMGEQALKTPLADKAGKALESWLDKQISSSSETTTKSDDKKSE